MQRKEPSCLSQEQHRSKGKEILTNSRQKGMVDGGSRDRRKEGEKVMIERRLWFNEETVIFRSERGVVV